MLKQMKRDMKNEWVRWKIPAGSDHLEGTGVSGRTALEQTLQKSGMHQILLLRTGTNGGLL